MNQLPEPDRAQSLISVQPAIFQRFAELLAAQSTRHGGVSAPPFATLNLGTKAGDDPAAVRQNRARFLTAVGISPDQLATARQVHGCHALVVTQAGPHDTDADALITQTPGVVVAVTVADCTPVLVYDAATRAVAAIHAGWRGTAAGIVGHALATMARTFGTRPADCHAYVGTCIGTTSFEVDADVADHFAADFKKWDAGRDKFLVDLKAANLQQLSNFGIPIAQIEVSAHCTVQHNADYFSYRREGPASGRMLALIGTHR